MIRTSTSDALQINRNNPESLVKAGTGSPYIGGRYLKAFDYIPGLNQQTHHILVYLGSRLSFDSESFVGQSLWPSIETISRATRIGKTTVRLRLRWLVNNGYITSKAYGKINEHGNWQQSSNRYALTNRAFWGCELITLQEVLNEEEDHSVREAVGRKIDRLLAKLDGVASDSKAAADSNEEEATPPSSDEPLPEDESTSDDDPTPPDTPSSGSPISLSDNHPALGANPLPVAMAVSSPPAGTSTASCGHSLPQPLSMSPFNSPINSPSSSRV